MAIQNKTKGELGPMWSKASIGGELSFNAMIEACGNIGFDLTCGACAELFYTGQPNFEHDETCGTIEEIKLHQRLEVIFG